MGSKKAVVTGAGSEVMMFLIGLLINEGYSVVAVSRSKIANQFPQQITTVQCDLSIPGQEFSFLQNADIVFHGAAISNTYDSRDYIMNNYQSTVNIVSESNRLGVKKIVYISSILAGYNYGDYGISKIESENYLTEDFTNWLIIRPSQLYGYSHGTQIDKTVQTILKKRIIFCPTGDLKSIYPLHYHDLAQLLINVSLNDSAKNQTLSAIGTKAYTLKELISETMFVLKKKAIIIPVPKIVIGMSYILLKVTHLKIGIYPDQLYRFLHGNNSLKESNGIGRSYSVFLRSLLNDEE